MIGIKQKLPLSSLFHRLVCAFYERVSLLFQPQCHYTLNSDPPQVSMDPNSKDSHLLNRTRTPAEIYYTPVTKLKFVDKMQT